MPIMYASMHIMYASMHIMYASMHIMYASMHIMYEYASMHIMYVSMHIKCILFRIEEHSFGVPIWAIVQYFNECIGKEYELSILIMRYII